MNNDKFRFLFSCELFMFVLVKIGSEQRFSIIRRKIIGLAEPYNVGSTNAT